MILQHMFLVTLRVVFTDQRVIIEKALFSCLATNTDSSSKLLTIVAYRLKSVEAIKMKFVAPMPEQIATTTVHFLKVSGKLL